MPDRASAIVLQDREAQLEQMAHEVGTGLLERGVVDPQLRGRVCEYCAERARRVEPAHDLRGRLVEPCAEAEALPERERHRARRPAALLATELVLEGEAIDQRDGAVEQLRITDCT